MALQQKTVGSDDEEIYEPWATQRYVVKRSHSANQEDELTLRVGELVEVRRKMKDGGYSLNR